MLTLSLAFCKAQSKLAMLTEYWQASPRTWLELSQGVNSSPLNPIELLGEPICYPSESVQILANNQAPISLEEKVIGRLVLGSWNAIRRIGLPVIGEGSLL